MDSVKQFKDVFREARTAKGLQQKDVAKMLDVVPAYISRLEKGFSLPSNDLILRVCDVLGLKVEEVYLQVMLEKTDNDNIRTIITSLIENVHGSNLTPEDRRMAEKFARLSEGQKKAISNLMDSFQAGAEV